MPNPLRLIVGLGNTGREYVGTRHNIGFWFVEALALRHRLEFCTEKRFRAALCRLDSDFGRCLLVKPSEFVNHSGACVRRLLDFYKLEADVVMIVHDDLDLPPGCIRARAGGGHGGHNGLRDIVGQLGGGGFARLRIGIGHPGSRAQVVPYVLSKPSSDEQQQIEQAIARGLACEEHILRGDIDQLMNRLNGPV